MQMLNPRLLDLELLRTLVAIVDSGSFSGAAARLSRSQSAVSLQVQRLESQVGHALLERAQGRLSGPTAEGHVLLDYARRLLHLHDEACSVFSRPPLRGPLRVGVPEELMEQTLPDVLEAFGRRCPEVRLSLRSELSVRLAAALDADELDLVLLKRTGDPAPPQGDMVRERLLRREPLIWLTGEGREAPWQRPLPLALFHEGCVFRVAVLAALAQAGVEPVLRFTGHSATGIGHAVAAGLGVTALPRSLMRPGLREVREGLPPLPDSLLLARWRGAQLPGAAQVLLELLQERL